MRIAIVLRVGAHARCLSESIENKEHVDDLLVATIRDHAPRGLVKALGCHGDVFLMFTAFGVTRGYDFHALHICFCRACTCECVCARVFMHGART